ncbi:hypothetical protein LCGC14_0142630 [marine sediment metagenome]|uniref:Uncharacterized protein n=1 Tax=marine sediment metagenome TaxID=412755 RepID=A0A0F9Y2V9_9ZZZZ
MKIRNCPECYGQGKTRLGHRSVRCGYCNGKKKLTSEFVKWDDKKHKQRLKIVQKLKEQMEAEIKTGLLQWENKNPKPRKFQKPSEL